MTTSDINIEEDVWALGNRPKLDPALQESRYNIGDSTTADRVRAAYLPGNPPQII